MHIESIDKVESGSVLGQSLYTSDGRVLLGRGVTLTQSYLNILQSLGYFSLYISDEFEDYFDYDEIVMESTRVSAIVNLKQFFSASLKSNNRKNLKIQSANISKLVKKIMSDVNAHPNLVVDILNLKSIDEYTFQHSVNVCIISVVLAVKAGFNGREIHDIAVASLLHDIGNLSVDAEILNKKGKLTKKEYTEIQRHTEKGFSFLLHEARMSPKIAIAAHQHHERIDGSGYPEGIAGSEIHAYSNLIGLVNVYDALTSDRHYRRRYDSYRALKTIQRKTNKWFSKKYVDILMQCVVPFTSGSMVKLSTGETALVIRNNEKKLYRPLLKLIYDSKGRRIDNGPVIDAMKDSGVIIKETIIN